MQLDVMPAEPATESPEVQPKTTPKPSYAPFFFALGITMAFWGLATSLVMSAAGFIVLAAALGLWIRDIAQTWRNSHAPES